MIADIVAARIAGFGAQGYLLALEGLAPAEPGPKAGCEPMDTGCPAAGIGGGMKP